MIIDIPEVPVDHSGSQKKGNKYMKTHNIWTAIIATHGSTKEEAEEQYLYRHHPGVLPIFARH